MFTIQNSRPKTFGTKSKPSPFYTINDPSQPLTINNITWVTRPQPTSFSTPPSNLPTNPPVTEPQPSLPSPPPAIGCIATNSNNNILSNIKENKQFRYLGMPVIGEIQIEYSLDQFPTASFSVMTRTSNLPNIRRRFNQNRMPLFIDTYEIRAMNVTEKVDTLNKEKLVMISFNCEHRILTPMEDTYQINVAPVPGISTTLESSRPPARLGQGAPIKAVTVNFDSDKRTEERAISLGSIRTPIPLQAPVNAYRFVDLKVNQRLYTTARQEINFLIGNHGLIIDNRRLIENKTLQLRRYGHKIKEIALDSRTILNEEQSSYSNTPIQIFPVIVSNLTVTERSRRPDSTGLLHRRGSLKSAFYFTPLSPRRIETKDNILQRYQNRAENPYAPEFLYSTVPLEGGLDCDLGDLTLLPEFPYRGEDPFIPDRPLTSIFETLDSDFLGDPDDEGDSDGDGDDGDGDDGDGDGSGEAGEDEDFEVDEEIDDPGDNFNPIYLNNSVECLESRSEEVTEARDFKDLADNGGKTGNYTRVCTKNGLPYTSLVQDFGNIYAGTGFMRYGIIRERFQRVFYKSVEVRNYSVKSIGFRVPTFETTSGYEEIGFDLISPEAPDPIQDESAEDFASRTYENENNEERAYYEEKFAPIQVPYRGFQTIEFGNLAKYFADLRDSQEALPLDFAQTITEGSSSGTRRYIITKDTTPFTFSIGEEYRNVTRTEITKTAKKPGDKDFYTVFVEGSNVTHSGNQRKRSTSSSYQQYEGRPSVVQYTRTL